MGAAHVAAVVLMIAVPVVLSLAVRRTGSTRVTRTVCWTLASILMANELLRYVHVAWIEGMAQLLSGSLPLHLCGVGLYLTAYVLVTRRQLAYEIAYYWGLAGALQAVITPALEIGFPSYYFVRFFITHGGIVAGVLFATWGLRMRPRAASVLHVFIITNVFVAAVAAIDAAFGWNYMYLCEKPGGTAGSSPFLSAPWPWYLLVLEPVTLAMFALLYAPFPFANWLQRHQTARQNTDGRTDE